MKSPPNGNQSQLAKANLRRFRRVDEFERAKAKWELYSSRYAWQAKLFPRLVFWGVVFILSASLIMMAFGIVQALGNGHEQQLANNRFFAPVISLQLVWLLTARFSPNSAPAPALAIGCIIVLFAPIVSGVITQQVEWQHYMIAFLFTFCALIVAPIGHFGLRSNSMFFE